MAADVACAFETAVSLQRRLAGMRLSTDAMRSTHEISLAGRNQS